MSQYFAYFVTLFRLESGDCINLIVQDDEFHLSTRGSKAVMQSQLVSTVGMQMQLRDGGFPYFCDVLFRAGVLNVTWFLPRCQSLYITKKNRIRLSGMSLSTTATPPRFDDKRLYEVIHHERNEGGHAFRAFLLGLWSAGVVRYTVDCIARTVTYYCACDAQLTQRHVTIMEMRSPPCVTGKRGVHC
ncbi:TPA: hypothetical protein SMF98_003976 [Serratia marcescens]|nr:hypothetical protein [Serratia marcescens]